MCLTNNNLTKTDIWIKFVLIAVVLFGIIDTTTGFMSCSPSPCRQGGSCISKPKGESYCNCSSRYVGEFCQYPNPCHTGPGPRCQNGGTCTVSFKDGTPVFTCTCPIGFTASLCEIHEKNACDSSPCQHGGTCNLKSLEQYTCSCAQGYTGMAGSRLEKIGTIFSRTSGLLRSGAMKIEDKPIWYDVYAAFPPPLEPRYDRPAPNINVKQIFYEEDVVRAKYHKLVKNVGTVNLSDSQYKTQTQLFIEAYKQIKSQGALDEDKIIEVAQDIVREKMSYRFESQKEPIGLVNSFTEASAKDRKTPHTKIDVKSIFE